MYSIFVFAFILKEAVIAFMVESTGISLFSHSSRKKRKAASRERGTPEQGADLRETDASVLVDQTRPVTHIGTAQSGETGDDKELNFGGEIQPTQPETRSEIASTSGRTAQDERPVTFRSLGVSEWLDRREDL